MNILYFTGLTKHTYHVLCIVRSIVTSSQTSISYVGLVLPSVLLNYLVLPIVANASSCSMRKYLDLFSKLTRSEISKTGLKNTQLCIITGTFFLSVTTHPPLYSKIGSSYFWRERSNDLEGNAELTTMIHGITSLEHLVDVQCTPCNSL